MAKSIVISSGHGKYIRGAADILDEVDEARRVVDTVAEYLQSAGCTVKTFHDNTSHDQSTNLNTIVNYHNKQSRDLDVSARYTVRADDGVVVSIVNTGYRHGPADILDRMAAGDMVDPALYYFRTTPRFEAPDDSRHAWLNQSVFVCSAARFSERVMLRFFIVE